MIAEKISKELNCDILELKPIVPYSNNYQEVVDDEQNSCLLYTSDAADD